MEVLGWGGRKVVGSEMDTQMVQGGLDIFRPHWCLLNCLELLREVMASGMIATKSSSISAVRR
jgi:hypothetical protein